QLAAVLVDGQHEAVVLVLAQRGAGSGQGAAETDLDVGAGRRSHQRQRARQARDKRFAFHVCLLEKLKPDDCYGFETGTASIKTKPTMQGLSLLLLHEWLVPRWTSTSPAVMRTSPSSMTAQISPS